MQKISEYIIYSTPTCGYCHMLKDWLTEHKVGFIDVNVATDPKRGVEMVQKTGQMGVPVSVISFDDGKEEVVLGFDRDRLSKILKI
ncbi:NrdH-redoxin [Patescibacteria group bacterium]|nr:NrdH-redoxin [Patescibacteria group bacterium]